MELDPQKRDPFNENDEADEAEDLPDDPSEAFVYTGADHRDMYILLAGLIAGLILSPWMLGRFLDEPTFEQFYFGAGEAWSQLDEKRTELAETRLERENALRVEHLARRAEVQQWYEQQVAEVREKLEASGATPIALDAALAELEEEYEKSLPTEQDLMIAQAALGTEREQELAPHRAMLDAAKQAHQDWLLRMVAGLIVAVVVLMFIEPVLQPLGRSAAVRTRLATGRYVLMASIVALLLCKAALLGGLPWLFVGLLVVIALVAAGVSGALGKPAKG